jgi:hypothetical protein
MERRRSTSYALVAGSLAFLMGCSGPPEEKILQDFFRASRLRDNTTLGNFATVSFDPRTDGVVQSFDVVAVGEERSHPLPLRQYAEELEKARAADEQFSQQKRAYQNANIAAIDRIMKAEASRRSLPARDVAVKTAWDKWVADAAMHTKAVSDAQHQIAANRGIVELSLAREAAGVDVMTLDGALLSKDVRIAASVRLPDGATVDQNYVVGMQRASMRDATGQELSGRWIITSIDPEES